MKKSGGGSNGKVTTPKVTTESKETSTVEPATTTTQAKDTSLSGLLSTEKVIGYNVEKVDKEEIPEELLFFENGKVTIIPGEEYGLTMGELSRMTDEEIWAKLETVKAAYAKKYVDEDMKLALADKGKEVLAAKGFYFINYTDLERFCLALEGQGTISDNDKANLICGYVEYMYSIGAGEQFGEQYMYEFLEKMEYAMARGELNGFLDDVKEFSDIIVPFYKNLYAEVQAAMGEVLPRVKGPFFDVPFTFVLMTDSSGNNVVSEIFAHATLREFLKGEPTHFNDGYQISSMYVTNMDIYTSTYNCISCNGYGYSGGRSMLCFREEVQLDTLNSKNVLIDLNDNARKELFKDEVLARYN